MQSITMTTLAAGPGGTFRTGETYELGTEITIEQAKLFVTAGSAAHVDEPTVEVAMTAPPTEKAVTDPPRESGGNRAAAVSAGRKRTGGK